MAPAGMARRGLVLACAIALAACVSARDTNSQGTSHYTAGLPAAGIDYAAGAGGVGPGGAGGVAGVPSAGTGVLDPMSSASGAGGAASVEMIAGTGGAGGAGGDAGTGPAGTGGAGGIGDTGGMDSAGGAGGAAGTGAGSGGATAGTLTIDFTSVGNGGEYAPRNVGAVWIETSSGQFVKTVERWAGIRVVHLTRWNEASGGWPIAFFFAAEPSPDEMDAVSAATLRPHVAHHSTWNGKNVDGQVVPDGSYRVVIEVTESNLLPSVSAEIPFEKGSAPQTLSPPDSGPYSGLTISYAP